MKYPPWRHRCRWPGPLSAIGCASRRRDDAEQNCRKKNTLRLVDPREPHTSWWPPERPINRSPVPGPCRQPTHRTSTQNIGPGVLPLRGNGSKPPSAPNYGNGSDLARPATAAPDRTRRSPLGRPGRSVAAPTRSQRRREDSVSPNTRVIHFVSACISSGVGSLVG